MKKRFSFQPKRSFFDILVDVLGVIFFYIGTVLGFFIRIFRYVGIKLIYVLAFIIDILRFVWGIIAYILNIVTYPLFIFVFVSLFILSILWSIFWFYLLLFFINPYKYLNKHYHVKARSILFLKSSWDWFLKYVFIHIKYIYLIFYINYMNFYVWLLWRPRNFLLKITIGIFLRVLEEIIDCIIDIYEFVRDVYIQYRSKFFFIFNRKRFTKVVSLRRVNKGKYYMRLIAFRYYISMFIFFFLTWYFTYFLLINSVEIGPWWGSWSIPSFCFFYCLFYYSFFYRVLKRWKKYLQPYLKDHLALFWCVACAGWVDAQFMPPESWGIPPGEFLPRILGFWF